MHSSAKATRDVPLVSGRGSEPITEVQDVWLLEGRRQMSQRGCPKDAPESPVRVAAEEGGRRKDRWDQVMEGQAVRAGEKFRADLWVLRSRWRSRMAGEPACVGGRKVGSAVTIWAGQSRGWEKSP